MDTKEKLKKVLEHIIEKNDTGAKAELKNIIQTDARYIAYKKLLKEYSFDFKTVAVDENVYNQIEEALKDFPRRAQLAILDQAYLRISKNEN